MDKIIIRPDADEGEATTDPEENEGSTFPKRSVSDEDPPSNYLNALLASPTRSLDFSEIPFQYDPDETEASGNPIVDGVRYFRSQRAKIEVNNLRTENEALKLKVAHLIAQLNETECDLDSILTENYALKGDVQELQRELDRSRILLNQAERQAREDAALIAKAREMRDADLEFGVLLPQITDLVADAVAVPDMEPVAPQEQTGSGSIKEVLSTDSVGVEPATIADVTAAPAEAEVAAPPEVSFGTVAAQVVVQAPAILVSSQGTDTVLRAAETAPEPLAPQNPSFYQSPEQVVTAPAIVIENRETEAGSEPKNDRHQVAAPRVHVPNHTIHQVAKQDRNSSTDTTATDTTAAQPTPKAPVHRPPIQTAHQKTRSTSRVIKTTGDLPNDHDKILPLLQPLVEAKIIEPKPAPVPPQPTVENEASEVDQTQHKELWAGAVDETNIESAPSTKVTTRKHIEHYRLIQNEADTGEANTVHDIIGKA